MLHVHPPSVKPYLACAGAFELRRRALSDGAIIGIAFGAFGGVMLLIGVVIVIRYMVC